MGFSNWVEENERKYVEVTYSGGEAMSSITWFVKYFEDLTISALKRTEITRSQSVCGCTVGPTGARILFGERIECQNVDNLPFSKKVFVTRNLLRHFSKEQQSQDGLYALHSLNRKCKIQ